MTIGIDSTSVKLAGHGMARYSQTLLHEFLRAEPDNRYVVYARSEAADLFTGFPTDRVSLRTIPHVRCLRGELAQVVRVALRESILRRDLRTPGIDLFWGTNGWLPTDGSCVKVVTIHDLATVVCAQEYTWAKRTYYHQALRRSARIAARVIVGSESARDDVARLLGIPAERMSKVYSGGVTPDYAPVQDSQLLSQVRQKYHLPERFLFTVGVMEPKKNVISAVRALARLRQQPETAVSLVVGGSTKHDARNQEVFQAIAELNLQDSVVFTGFIAEPDMPAVYSLAKTMVFPSRYEGFGLPVLEAMACGTPVVASRVSSLPEICGDAAILVDPLNPGEIAEACRTILLDPTRADELRARGFRNMARFSWAASARGILDVFARAASQRQVPR
jgi:glycosyltransferase involved in cell wall biosynthesis